MSAGGKIVESDRLVVRRLDAASIEPLAQLWTDPDVTRFMGGPRDLEKVSASLREVLAAPDPARFDLWPVFEKTSGRLVGHCGLLAKTVDDCSEVELVYVLATAFQGRGYATEVAAALRDYAARTLGLKRLVALLDPAHAASARVAIKVGMKFETETRRPNGKTLHLYAVAI